MGRSSEAAAAAKARAEERRVCAVGAPFGGATLACDPRFVSVLGSILRVLFSRIVGPRRLHSLAPSCAVLVYGFGGRWDFGNWGWSFCGISELFGVDAIIGSRGRAAEELGFGVLIP